ncbi:MAG: tetratricopeptide repeat protein [Rhodoferax sp.]|nr:tetratricopeptide repeat protein [Rhodoferax sp.]
MTQADSAQTGASLTIDQALQQATTLNAIELKSLRALFRAGRYAEAVGVGEAMTRRFPERGHGWMILATALNRLGRIEEAIGPMQKSVELSPDDAEAHSNLGAMFKAAIVWTKPKPATVRALQINRPARAEPRRGASTSATPLQAQRELPESVLATDRHCDSSLTFQTPITTSPTH